MINKILNLKNSNHINCYLNLICLLAGFSLVFSFSPYSFSFIAFISIAILFFIIDISLPKKAFIRGYLFGLGLFGYGISWVYVSLTSLGDSPVWLSIIITILFIGLISIFPAIFAYFSAKIFAKSKTRTLLIFPAFWILVEIMRGWIFTGFPWLSLGYSQTNTLLGSYAKIGSVSLVSIIVCLVSALIVLIFQIKYRYCKILPIIAISLLFLGGWILGKQNFVYDTHQSREVLLIQGNIKQTDKWDAQKTMSILNTYYDLTEANIKDNMLVFWPENAIPLFPYQVKSYLNVVDKLAEDHHASILIGLPILNRKTKQYYNGATVIGYGYGTYLKHLLVPFGEYFPMQWLTKPFVKMMNVPMSSFTPGPEIQPTLKMGKINVSVLICYESAFPTQVRKNIQNAQLLVTLSDDAWFGHTIGSAQHLEMARMRAIETGRYVVQATNNGTTAIINNKGEVTNTIPQFTRGALSGKVYLISGETPWLRYGMPPIFMLIFLMIIIKIVYKHPFATKHKKQ
ncbi:MAG: apolipoprotein N-acyltransferase [Francisellaceae bacterium]|jgi:apolipoprotein N-acyltransferase